MFNLLLESRSDITKKELINNESVRDSVFRYCPEDSSDFLSIDFLAPKTQSIMDIYKVYEAELMIKTLTKDLESKRDKMIKIVQNFRSELIFGQTVFNFIIKEYFGKNGPVMLK